MVKRVVRGSGWSKSGVVWVVVRVREKAEKDRKTYTLSRSWSLVEQEREGRG